MTCHFAHDDGAYVLGALAPAERAAFENHLPGCAACRESVSRLAVLPGLLRRMGEPETATPLLEAPDRLPVLLERVSRKRRRRRFQTVLSAISVACVLFAAALGVVAWRDTPSPGPALATMSEVGPATRVQAEVGVTQVAGGIEVIMHCTYPDAGTATKPYVFRLVAVGADGVAEQVGSWTAGPGDDLWITGTVRFTLSDLERIEIRSRDGTVLLVYQLS